MLRALSRYLKRNNQTDLPTMSRKIIEQIPAPLHRGMTQLDRGAFVTEFTRLGIRVNRQDVTKVTKAREIQP